MPSVGRSEEARLGWQALWNLALVSMSMFMIAYARSLSKVASACDTRRGKASGLPSTQRSPSCISLLARNWPLQSRLASAAAGVALAQPVLERLARKNNVYYATRH
jgi:hypothetical protein